VARICQGAASPQREQAYLAAQFPARVPQAQGSTPARATVARYTSRSAFTAIVSISQGELLRVACAVPSPRE
jgi:hypothetical protein